LTGRDIADILAETIDRSLYPLGAQPPTDRPVTRLFDEDVQAVADGLMDSAHERQLNFLIIPKARQCVPVKAALDLTIAVGTMRGGAG